MKYCLQNYITHQFTYFIYYLFQDKFKYPKIIKIQQVQQKIYTKHVSTLKITCYYVKIHLNMNHIGFTGEPVT